MKKHLGLFIIFLSDVLQKRPLAYVLFRLHGVLHGNLLGVLHDNLHFSPSYNLSDVLHKLVRGVHRQAHDDARKLVRGDALRNGGSSLS